MDIQEFVPIDIFCQHYQVEVSFVNALHAHGLVEIVYTREVACIPEEQLVEAERYTRLHHDLDLSVEGLAAVSHLLEKVKSMQEEIDHLRSQLGFYSR